MHSNVMAALRSALAAQLLGRDRESEIITLALIAREHVLLVGPPGTAKSLLCRVISKLVSGMRYCERLMSPTTAPEAVWGPISLSALRNDRYEHITAGYVADAHLVYLDEVGRMSPAIGDSLLHALGPERQALVGTQQLAMPLVSAIGSANTWPEDAALLDRWLLRATVQSLTASDRRSLMTFAPPACTPVATLADLDDAHARAMALPIAPATLDTLDAMLADLDEAGVTVSDRRLRASLKIARAACVLRGGDEVLPIDLEPLQYVLWSTTEQAPIAAAKIVARANPVGARLNTILAEVDEIVRAAVDAPTRLAASTKLTALLDETSKLAASPSGNGRAAKVQTYVKREHVRITGVMLGLSAAQIAELSK
jgi:MoxR-like ATPase